MEEEIFKLIMVIVLMWALSPSLKERNHENI